MSIKKKKKDKKSKVKAKLKNIAKGKVSTKMYRKAPVSRSVPSYTPASKQVIDKKAFDKAEQIKKETGTVEDIQENGKSEKWLSGFMVSFKSADNSGQKEFKYDGKRYKTDPKLHSLAERLHEDASAPAGKFSKAYTDWVLENFSKDIKRGTDPDKIMADSKVQRHYTIETGLNPVGGVSKPGLPSKPGIGLGVGPGVSPGNAIHNPIKKI